MRDFGGMVRRDDESRGRSRKAVIAVVFVVSLAVAIAWLAQGRVTTAPEAPAEERIEEAAAKILPSIDPRGETAQRYPGSPWERRNNILLEIVEMVEQPGDPYDLSEEVRDYVRGLGSTLDDSCAEVLSKLSRDPVTWAGVVTYAGGIREDLLYRYDAAVSPWPESHSISLRGVKQLFVCR
jgi:hypothetical protein